MIKYQLFTPCEMAINGEEPPTFHGQCLVRLGRGDDMLLCSCSCHKETK